MANTKKKKTTTKKTNAKKTTTKKKKSTTTTTKKKATRNSSVSASKKTSVSKTKKSTTPKKTSTTKKKTTTSKKVTTPKKVATPKVETKEVEIKKVETKEVEPKVETQKVIKSEEPVIKAGQTQEISKNKNVPNKVVEEEKFTGVKNAKKQVKGKTKSKESTVAFIKKHKFFSKLSKIKRKIRIYGISSVIPKKYIIATIFLVLFMVILPTTIYFFQEPAAKMDLSSIEEIDTLKTLSLNLDKVDDIITSTNAFTSLKNYDRYDFESIFKLNSEHVSDFVLKYNESKKQLLFIIKPTNNNYDNVKESIKSFLDENKISIKESSSFDYDGYIIYIKSKSDEADTIVKSKIMQSTKNVFTLLLDLKKDDIESTLKISNTLYSEAIVKVARLKSDTCGYAIFKPTSIHAKNKIMAQMDEYYKSLEEKWADNQENLNLVKNRYFEDYDGYLIYIISNNNKLVMDLIKSK